MVEGAMRSPEITGLPVYPNFLTCAPEFAPERHRTASVVPKNRLLQIRRANGLVMAQRANVP